MRQLVESADIADAGRGRGVSLWAMKIGVVGATGQVGSVMRQLLAERNFPVSQIRYFASSRSAGTTLDWKGTQITVEDAATRRRRPVSTSPCSRRAPPRRASWHRSSPPRGAMVIDNSSAWRMDPDVPLIVSEVNPGEIANARKGIIANPNCTTMAAMPVLKPLHDEAGLVRLIASTYQAVSGCRALGRRRTRQAGPRGGRSGPRADPRRCRGGLPCAEQVRQADRLQRLAVCRQVRRRRFVRDRRRAEAAQREPQDPRHPRSARQRHLRAGSGVHRPFAQHQRRVRAAHQRRPGHRDPRRRAGVALSDIPTPLEAAGRDPSFVGRIRQDPTVDGGRGLVLFVSNDNLRKGAALNAIQIAELLL